MPSSVPPAYRADPRWPVVTPRLALRPVAPDDAEAFFAWRSRPDVVRFMYQPPWDRQTADLKLRTWSSAPFEEPGDVLVLAVESDGDVVGETMLKWAVGPRQAEVGYALHPDVGGHGLATEAVRATLRLAFESYGFHRVFARIDEENLPSVRVVQRLGLRQEARLVESDERDGGWSTELVFAILDREHAERELS
ncbi:GNAT family N-acetyltransferase [Promicromonospora sp. NPDC090134]|uniref:GNAT family N-acetyltransferase n=1 Tax=Promicromonospora sp. NPDC090134 TaxID=3364408 RepID=UPI003810B22A